MIIAKIVDYYLDSTEKEFSAVVEKIHEVNKEAEFEEEWRDKYYHITFKRGIDTQFEDIT